MRQLQRTINIKYLTSTQAAARKLSEWLEKPARGVKQYRTLTCALLTSESGKVFAYQFRARRATVAQLGVTDFA